MFLQIIEYLLHVQPFAEHYSFFFFIPQQQNAMGSLHNIDFGVFCASWCGSGKEPGSGNDSKFRWVPSPRFRSVPTGSGAPSSVLGTGSGFWLRRFQRFRVSLPSQVRKVAAVSKVLELKVFDGF